MYDKLGKYQIIKKLGEGLEGRVYLVLDENTKEKYALKICKNEAEGRREAGFLRVLHHPGIVRLHDCFYAKEGEEDVFVLVTEYANGESLKDYCIFQNTKRKGEGDSGKPELCKKLAEILKYLHSLPVPVIHCDLKPENIVVRENGDVTLFDFGSARRIGEDIREMKSTYAYAAPEIAIGKCSPAIDIYAFGQLMILIFTGKVPTWNDQIPTKKAMIRMGIPKTVYPVILDCLRKDKEERIPNGTELVRRILRCERKNGRVLRVLSHFREVLFTNAGAIGSFYGLFRYYKGEIESGKMILLIGVALLLAELLLESVEKERRFGNVFCKYSLHLSQTKAQKESQ